MKTAHRLLLFATIALTIPSCASDPGERIAHDAADAPSTSTLTEADANSADSTTVLPLTDPARKILRTADLRCRVTDAYAAASALESTVRAVDGSITESRLTTDEISTQEIPHGDDSLKQLRTFITTAHLTLRIPAAKLDSVVRLVPQGALFLHHRTLLQEDATLRYLSAKLKNKAADHTDDALAKARRTGDVITASEYEEGRTERRIDRRIENLDILDRAAFATLTVEYYQPQSVDAQVVVNPAAVARTPLGGRMGSALLSGWRGMDALLVALVALWPLWLLSIAGVMLYRAWRRGAVARTVVPKP